MKFDFAFLTSEEAQSVVEGVYWFLVGDILDIKEQWEVNEYLIQHGLSQLPQKQALFANRTLFKLWSIIHDSRIINYYLETDESLDKVLNFLFGLTVAGTVLSYSDLLLSIATAHGKTLMPEKKYISGGGTKQHWRWI
jgi:hypothetical protein